MSKDQFLWQLRMAMQKAELGNIDNVLDYYNEMLEDRMEDGMTEEEAVASMESIESIIATLKADKPLSEVVKGRIKESKNKADKKGHTGLWIALAIIGSPIWLALLLAGVVILFALFVTVWSLIIAFFATTIALGAAAVACLIGAPVLLITGLAPGVAALALFGAALFLAGLSIFLWSPVVAFAKFAVRMLKKAVLAIKKKITGKGSEE